MNMLEVEAKWNKKWEEEKTYKFDPSRIDKKYYVLEMFSYPSGAKLHVGHWFNYGPSDSFARFKRMQGYEVFQPMGFDAFGLPAENYAIKTGIHPKDSTMKNIATMEKQLKNIGATYDWDYEVVTCDPKYYKWTQWLFLQMYKHDLAYRKEAPVNWCPSCQTVLANEQVVDGCCERCGTTVVRKNLTQWFFRITKYAEELLNDIDKLDWPEKTKLMQKHWIGKSTGGEIEFKVKDKDVSFRVFTTRADTIFGITYVVLAPESPLVDKVVTEENKQIVEDYKLQCSKINEIERLSSSREKTGVFTGSYAINPINGREVPILVADYVLASYGTGAVMGVAAHDDRDYVFAKKHGLPIERVIRSKDGSPDDLPYTDYGIMCNSGEFDGMTTEEGRIAVIRKLEKEGKGELKTNYRLRDWLISRQRYWGAPIPVIHCPHCGAVPVPEKDLPVELPYNVNFTPDGESPLKKCDEFMNVKCPVCGADAKRDPDTLDTFVCSSWYYLRYVDPKNDKEAFSREKVDKMLPVDKYIGGAEHACMHLLYARFFTKALRDMGYLDFDEPFKSLVHQGTILGPDGQKMSKSRGNVVNPDEIVDQYGADTMRLYEMFIGDFEKAAPWNSDSIKGCKRFLERYWNLQTMVTPEETYSNDLETLMHQTIQKVTEDIDQLKCNTAIAALMTLLNKVYDKGSITRGELRTLTVLLNPFAPHVTEEMWEVEQFGGMVHEAQWPAFDPAKTKEDTVEIVLQVLGKVRSRMTISADTPKEEVLAAAKADSKIAALLEGKTIKKEIYVPGKLVNFVAI